MSDKNDLSVELTNWRVIHKLDQEKAATLLGVSQRTLEGWERGRHVHNVVAPWIIAAMKWTPAMVYMFMTGEKPENSTKLTIR